SVSGTSSPVGRSTSTGAVEIVADIPKSFSQAPFGLVRRLSGSVGLSLSLGRGLACLPSPCGQLSSAPPGPLRCLLRPLSLFLCPHRGIAGSLRDLPRPLGLSIG